MYDSLESVLRELSVNISNFDENIYKKELAIANATSKQVTAEDVFKYMKALVECFDYLPEEDEQKIMNGILDIEKARATVDAQNLEVIKKDFMAFQAEGKMENFEDKSRGFVALYKDEDGLHLTCDEEELIGIEKKEVILLTQSASGDEQDFEWYKDENSKDRWEIVPIDENKDSVNSYDILDENGNVIGNEKYKNGRYYWIQGDNGVMYQKRWPNEGTTKLTNDDYNNISATIDIDNLNVSYVDANGTTKTVDVKENYELWWKYQDTNYKVKHPLTSIEAFEDYLAFNDPAFVIWYEDTSCDYKWFHNFNDEETKKDYGIDPKAPENEPEEEITEEPAIQITPETPDTTETPDKPSTPDEPFTPDVIVTPGKPEDVTPAEPTHTDMHFYIAVYSDHMEVYNDSQDEALSEEFLEHLGYNANYDGESVVGDFAASTKSFKTKLGKSSYVLEAKFNGTKYEYTVYLSGRLANYKYLFTSYGEVVVVD